MVYMRGQAGDYDHWRQLGLAGLVVGRRAAVSSGSTSDHFLGDSEHHGVGGEWRVEYPRLRWDILDAWREAAAQYGIPHGRRLQHRRQRRLLLFPRQPEARPALVGGARLPEAGAAAAESAAGNRLPGRAPRSSTASARPACASGRTARRAARAAAARSSWRPARSARRRSCCCRASGRPAHLPQLGIPVVLDKARRRRQPARPSATAHDLQGQRHPHAQRDVFLAVRRAPRWASTTRCSGAGR